MRNALTGWIGAAFIGTVGAGLSGCDEIVVVEDLPDAPTCTLQITFLDSPGAKTVVEGTQLTFNLTGQGDPRGVYSYTMASAPPGASLDADDGVFTYTPNAEVSTLATDTPFDVKFTVAVPPSDSCPDGAQSTAITVTITVLNDQDEDGTADDDDTDRDGDGLDNGVDTAPDDADRDDDGDLDGADNCPDDANADQADEDDDDIGNVCDDCPGDPVNDPDGDEICDLVDNCPDDRNIKEDCDGNNATPTEQCDNDGDGLGEVLAAASGTTCDPCPGDTVNDPDNDLACATRNDEAYDNCPLVANPFDCSGASVIDAQGNLTGEQCDSDGDGRGDACDECPDDATDDEDGDDVCQDVDNCPGIANPIVGDAQPDMDDDGKGDACDDDTDGDSVLNGADNCVLVANDDQTNTDGDAEGDACDTDDDDDGVLDAAPDNCPLVENPSQLDPDGDGVGYQCDTIEEVPFAVHEGTATVRVDGDAQAGTVALSFRGPALCTRAQPCVKPGVFVVDEADESYIKRQTTGDTTSTWLDLLPPAGDLYPPHVAQNGVAYFPADTASGFDLRKITAGVVAEVFPVAKVFDIARLVDAPDGKTVIQARITSGATTPGQFIAETLAAGQPSPITSGAGEAFVDSAGNGPMTFDDETLYLPARAPTTNNYTLLAYKRDGSVSVVQVPTGLPSPSPANLAVQNATDLRFVGVDPVRGSPWYCWRTTDGASSRTAFFQVHGGTVIHQKKTNWNEPCASVRAERSPAGAWFFIGPATPTVTNRRVATWVPDADDIATNDNPTPLADVYGSAGVAGQVFLHHTNGHTFLEQRTGVSETTHTYELWTGTARQLVGAVVYNAVADVEPATNRLGVVGRTTPMGFNDSGIVALRYQGGVSTGTGESRTVVALVGEFDAASGAWIGPNGTIVATYFNAGKEILGAIPVTTPVTALNGDIAPNATNVTYHGSATIVSFTASSAGQIGFLNETGAAPTFVKLVDGRKHDAFQAGVLPPGTQDAFIAYPTPGVTPTYVVAQVGTTGAPTLTSSLTGLLSPPDSVAMGPDQKLWFAYETSAGIGYASTSGTTLTPFVTGMTSLEVVVPDRGDKTTPWGIVVRNSADDAFACRLPVTVGPTTSPAGCWEASVVAQPRLHWWDIDDRGVLHLVTSGGTPTEVSLFRSIGEPELDPAEIP